MQHIKNKLLCNLELYILIVIYFLFLYGINLPVVSNSSYIAFFIIFIFIFKNGVLNQVGLIVRDKIVLFLICFSFILIFISFITSVVNATDDYSILTTHVNNLATIVFSIVFIAYFITMKNRYELSIFKFLSIVFFIQCFFVLLMLLFPSVSDSIQSIIKTDSQIARMESYNGIRGLGLTGFVAFGFSVTMGVLYPIFAYWIKYEAKLNDVTKIILLLTAAICSLSAGRTSILGIFIAVLIIFFPIRFNIYGMLKAIKIIIMLGVIVLISVFFIFNNPDLKQIAIYYSRYVFQSIWNYLEYGSFSIQSLNHLDTMYFYPENINWLIGTGHYTNADGTYYMHTDAGYMRFLLYFGLLGSLITYFFFSYLSMSVIYREESRRISILLSLLFLSTFIYHYKGEVVLFNVPYNRVYILIFLWIYFYKRESFE